MYPYSIYIIFCIIVFYRIFFLSCNDNVSKVLVLKGITCDHCSLCTGKAIKVEIIGSKRKAINRFNFKNLEINSSDISAFVQNYQS